MTMVNIGYGNFVSKNSVITIIKFGGSPSTRVKRDAEDAGKFINGSEGRKTRSLIIQIDGIVTSAAICTASLAPRFEEGAAWIK